MTSSFFAPQIDGTDRFELKPDKPVAAVLFSGGLDSTTILFLAKSLGFEVHAISFFYGQRNSPELKFAAATAATAGVKHIVMRLDESIFSASGSALVNSGQSVEDGAEVGADEVPNTYVPARNMLFISHGIAYLESVGGFDLFVGVNVVDYGNYPDCRRNFIDHLEAAATLGSKACSETGGKYTIHTPIIDMNKAQIIKLGVGLGVKYGETMSCYNPSQDGLACGVCLSCLMRKKGFLEAGVDDPTLYLP